MNKEELVNDIFKKNPLFIPGEGFNPRREAVKVADLVEMINKMDKTLLEMKTEMIKIKDMVKIKVNQPVDYRDRVTSSEL